MCGRYVLQNADSIPSRFDAEFDASFSFSDNFNTAPSQLMPVITRNSPNKVQLMKWGLIPVWAKDPKIGFKMINARSETIMEKPSFKSPFQKHRCLIPTTGFYEWKKEGTTKIPHFIHMQDNSMFAFAGITSVWKDAEGMEVYTYSIITTKANVLMADIHERMPVILRKDDEDMYLDNETPIEVVQEMLIPYSPNDLEAYAVSTEVNKPSNNYSALLTKL